MTERETDASAGRVPFLSTAKYEGVSAELMLMGVNRAAISLASEFSLRSEIAFFNMLKPHAVLLSCGRNRGLQANGGVSASVGYMS